MGYDWTLGRITAVLAATIALSACEMDGETAPAAKTATPEAAAAGDVQNARINLGECSGPRDGNVYFKVGERALAVPGSAVGDVIPTSLTPPYQKEQVKTELQEQARQGGGCPEKPIDAALLLINGDLQHPLLQGTVALVRTPKGDGAKRYAQLTSQLQANPNENCQTIGGDLMACVGTERRGDRQTPVMYVITTDTTKTMNTGGPLAARCVLAGEKIQGCNIVDQLDGGLTYDATLNAGDYSTAGLASARQAANQQITSLLR